jgi:hypothetical protein
VSYSEVVANARPARLLELGVIMAARARRRRRIVLLVAALAAAGGGLTLATVEVLGPAAGRVAYVRPAAVLAQPPYMAPACRVANSIACDRIGLAVWLRRPAVWVDATVGGRTLKLDWHGDQPPRFARRGSRTAFDGFVQPAGLLTRLGVRTGGGSFWAPSPSNAPAPLVTVRIGWGNGRISVTHLSVPLSGGWG